LSTTEFVYVFIVDGGEVIRRAVSSHSKQS